MIDCSQAAVRPILVAASEASDAGLARSAIEELGIVPVLVQDVVEAMRHVCGNGRRYGAMVVGERLGEVSGFTLCAVARDAGCRLPLILLTADVCRWAAVRAAKLQVTVLWHPLPARRIVQTLRATLPRTACGQQTVVELPAWPNVASTAAPALVGASRSTIDREKDRWRRSSNLW
jgi:DNA-binding NtrC family response regulator